MITVKTTILLSLLATLLLATPVAADQYRAVVAQACDVDIAVCVEIIATGTLETISLGYTIQRWNEDTQRWDIVATTCRPDFSGCDEQIPGSALVVRKDGMKATLTHPVVQAIWRATPDERIEDRGKYTVITPESWFSRRYIGYQQTASAVVQAAGLVLTTEAWEAFSDGQIFVVRSTEEERER